MWRDLSNAIGYIPSPLSFRHLQEKGEIMPQSLSRARVKVDKQLDSQQDVYGEKLVGDKLITRILGSLSDGRIQVLSWILLKTTTSLRIGRSKGIGLRNNLLYLVKF